MRCLFSSRHRMRSDVRTSFSFHATPGSSRRGLAVAPPSSLQEGRGTHEAASSFGLVHDLHTAISSIHHHRQHQHTTTHHDIVHGDDKTPAPVV